MATSSLNRCLDMQILSQVPTILWALFCATLWPWSASSTSCVWSHMSDYAFLVGLVSPRNGYQRNLLELPWIFVLLTIPLCIVLGDFDWTINRGKVTVCPAAPDSCNTPRNERGPLLCISKDCRCDELSSESMSRDPVLKRRRVEEKEVEAQ